METGKVIRADGMPDGRDMKGIDKPGYTYLGILETDKIKRERNKGRA